MGSISTPLSIILRIYSLFCNKKSVTNKVSQQLSFVTRAWRQWQKQMWSGRLSPYHSITPPVFHSLHNKLPSTRSNKLLPTEWVSERFPTSLPPAITHICHCLREFRIESIWVGVLRPFAIYGWQCCLFVYATLFRSSQQVNFFTRILWFVFTHWEKINPHTFYIIML